MPPLSTGASDWANAAMVLTDNAPTTVKAVNVDLIMVLLLQALLT
jgi:hypothetical protein